MEENTKLQGTKKTDWGALIVGIAIIVVVVILAVTQIRRVSLATAAEEAEFATKIAEARANGDRYTLMTYADGTENFPMNVEREIGEEYINRIEFQYGESQAGGHYVRTIFYLGKEEEKYGGYGDLWVDSEYEGVENPLLSPEVAEYDPLADMGLSLPELFEQARADVNGLPEGIFYCADSPGAIGAKAAYDQNTIIYFYTEKKYKAAAVMFDWETNLTHAAFYD